MTSYAENSRAVSPLSEEQEDELASELMDVGSDAELEQFLGNLFGTIGRDAARFLRSPAGHALGGILKGVAKKALPVVGGALGSAVAPGIGTVLGSQLGSIASNLFEMELGPIAEDDAQFEVARRTVQLMAAAAIEALQAPARPGVSPKAAAWEAVLRAARQYAPGLYRQLTRPPARAGSGSGQNKGTGAEEHFGGFAARGGGAAWPGRPAPAGRWRPVPRGTGPGLRPGFRRRPGSPVDDGGVIFTEPVLDEPLADVPTVAEPVIEEPILTDWGPAAGPGGQASLEVGGQPRQTASGRWERQGRRIILRGV